jgi:hypothetical protein
MTDRWDPYSARWVTGPVPQTSPTSTPMPPRGSWFGPMQPMSPAAQDATEGRAFDYPVGYNLRVTPRAGELTSFAMLRAFADSLPAAAGNRDAERSGAIVCMEYH